jgi:ferrous-iron efflux pump FieF
VKAPSPDGDHRKSIEQSGVLMRRAAIASVSVSLFLVAIKTFAYFASHSVAMLASLADSALDLFTSSLNLIAIRSALTPADAEHRFGHGRPRRWRLWGRVYFGVCSVLASRPSAHVPGRG